MSNVKKNENDLFFYICILLWALSISFFGLWLAFRSYTPIPAAASMAALVLNGAMVLLIAASIWGCIYIIHLITRT